MRSTPFTLSNSFIKSINDSSLPLPKSPMFTPVKTISFLPELAILFAALTMENIFPLLLLPRASGIVQNEHV